MNATQVNVGGAVTFWSCAKADRDKLEAALAALNCGYEDFVPKERTSAAALKAALEAIAKDKRSRLLRSDEDIAVVPLRDRSKNGFEVVLVQKGLYKNQYPQIFAAKVRNNGFALDLTADASSSAADCPPLDLVTSQWEEQRETLPQHSVGSMLKHLATQKFDGVSLRPMGGLYWLAGHKTEAWNKMCEAVEGVCDVHVHNLVTKFDEAAIRAVRDGLTAEVEQECSRIAEEAFSGNVGKRALEARKSEAMGVRSKIKRYEAILGKTMEDLTELAKLSERAAATAILQSL